LDAWRIVRQEVDSIPMDEIMRQIQNSQKIIMRTSEVIQKEKKEEIERSIALLAAAQETAINTRTLSDIVTLIRSNNEKQEEIFDLLVEMLSISKASNKKEAEGIFKKVMDKAVKLGSNYDSITKLAGLGKVILILAFGADSGVS
jgi:flagellar biosynthesis regulator FlaF